MLVHYYFFKKNNNKMDDGLTHGANPVVSLRVLKQGVQWAYVKQKTSYRK